MSPTDGDRAACAFDIELDGAPAAAWPGETLLTVARRQGVDVPTLCHADGLEPAGNCRVCVVEVEGERALAASCCRQARPGMKISSTSARALRARALVTELLLADAGTNTASLKGDCELHDTALKLGVTKSRFPQRNQADSTPDVSHPAIAVRLDACIQCTRCLRACRDVQVNDVIALAGRGASGRIVFDSDVPLGESSCVACGECVQACPTGALAPAREAGMAPVDARIDSVCPYCGVGCQLTWHVGPAVDGGRTIHFVTGRDGPANRGRLCVKGRYGFDYLRHPERLTQPLIRRAGAAKDPADIERVRRGQLPLDALFRPAGWDEALAFAAGGLLRVRQTQGGAALAGFGSAKGSNEEAYLFQKLVRTGLQTNNVDHCTRLCHASSVAALLEGLGSGAVSNPVADVAQAELIVVIGANPSVNHPVAASWIKNAVKRGARLVLADPRRTPLARHAHWHLAFRPDTDVALLSALLHVIIAEGLTDPDFIAARVDGFDALKAAVAEATPERMAEICGIDAGTLRAVARAYASARSAMILWGMGISQHVHGTDNARCLIALALITGQIGRPGTGLHPLRGQNNVQGASDAGLIPMMLPAYRRVAQAEARAQFEALWGQPLAEQPGLTVVEIMHAIHAGQIRGMVIEGENPAMSDPDLQHARAALATLDHLVVQDIFPTETAILADVILPGSAHAEKWGSYTNTDRLIQVGRPALEPPGAARQDLWIIEQLGRRLGLPWQYWIDSRDGHGQRAAEAATAAVYEEMRAVMPGLAGVPWVRLVREDAVMTPARHEHEPGLAVEFSERFPTADGRGRLVPAHYHPGPEQADEQFPLLLATGRLLEHWHTGAMTRRAAVLDALAPQAEIAVHPHDAQRLCLSAGSLATITTRHGQIEAWVHISDAVQPGQLFLPFAYWEAAANRLTGAALDPVGKIPGFKVTAARIAPSVGAQTEDVDGAARAAV